jgi:hypothetical protein
VIIKVERSGGLTGISTCNEMDIKDLPSTLISTAKKIMNDNNYSLPITSAPRGSADYYTYKISILDGVNQRVIDCNQYNIREDLKSLVKYIERNSRNK